MLRCTEYCGVSSTEESPVTARSTPVDSLSREDCIPRWQHDESLFVPKWLEVVGGGSGSHLLAILSVRLAVAEPVVHVLTVRARVGKALEALLALKRFLAAVQPLVLRQVVLVLESLFAHITLVRPLPCESKEDAKRSGHVPLFLSKFSLQSLAG